MHTRSEHAELVPMARIAPPRRNSGTNTNVDELDPAGEFAAAVDDLAATAVMPPNTDWASPQVQAWRSRVTMGMAAFTGMILAVGAIGYVATQRSTADQSAAATSPLSSPDTHAPAIDPTGHEVDSEEDGKAPEGDTTEGDTTEGDTTDETADVEETEQGTAAEASVAVGADVERSVVDSAIPSDTNSSDTNLSDTNLSDTEPDPATGPEAAESNIASRETAEQPSDATAIESPSELDDSVEGVDPLFDAIEAAPNRNLFAELAGLSETDIADMSLTPPTTEVAPEPVDPETVAFFDRGSPSVPRFAVEQPTMRPVNVPERLRDPVAAIKLDSVRLSDFVNFITDVSTIPVTLDVDALNRLGLAPQAPITVAQRDTTVEGLLKEAIAPLELEVTPTELGVVITTPETSQQQREKQYPVMDLLGTDERSTRTIAYHLRMLTGAGRWEKFGGRDSLTIVNQQMTVNSNDAGHTEVQRLLNQLRIARGLAVQSEQPERWYSGTTRVRRCQQQLSQEVTLYAVRSIAFRELVQELESRTSFQIVVNWQALAEAGWPWDTPRTLSVQALPLDTTLEKLLGPMQLTFRVVDDELLEITTLADELQKMDTEWYDVSNMIPRLPAGKSIEQHVHEVVGIRHFDVGGGMGHVYLDEPSQKLFVRLPQSLQFLVERSFLNALDARQAATR
ncbi:MAG: hypothetical protein KDA60_06320 [Planctomycetales bacterium]|nr:hypothetical protein [Planctomycetales bacterium]